jgi:hypothetical protein
MDIGEVLLRDIALTVYGDLVEGLSIPPDSPIRKSVPTFAEGIYLVSTKGFATAGRSVRISPPVLVLLPSQGDTLKSEECGWSTPTRKWTTDPSLRTAAFSVRAGTLGGLLSPPTTREINVSGGASFDNWHFENGNVCCTAHIWAKVEVCAPIVGCKNVLDFNQAFPICVGIGACYTFFDLGYIKGDVCYNPPKQLCVEVTANVANIWSGVVFKQCVDVPIALAS